MSSSVPWTAITSGFTVHALETYLAPNGPNGSVRCELATPLFRGVDKDAMLNDPASLNTGASILVAFLTSHLPSTLNQTRPGEMLEWWLDSAENDASNMTSFLRSISRACSTEICEEAGEGLDPDVSGVGILISNSMLAIICLLFFTFTIFHIHTRANTSERGHHSCATNPICVALRGTVEDVFDATLVFSLALHIATLDFRARGATRSDVIYAESLCTFVGIACLTMWHMRAEVTRQKWTTQVAFTLMCVLNFVVYVLRQMPHKQALDLYGPLCQAGTEAKELWFMDPFTKVYWVFCMLMFLMPMKKLTGLIMKKPIGHSGLMRWRMWQAFWGMGALIVHIFMLGSTRNKYLDHQAWGIGQYLAVATWVPALLKMGYILNAGAEVGLTVLLPRPWVALQLNDNTETKELPSLARIVSQGASLLGLPAYRFTLRRPDSEESLNGTEEEQISGIIEANDGPRKNTESSHGSGKGEKEPPGYELQRRDTDATLVGDEMKIRPCSSGTKEGDAGEDVEKVEQKGFGGQPMSN